LPKADGHEIAARPPHRHRASRRAAGVVTLAALGALIAVAALTQEGSPPEAAPADVRIDLSTTKGHHASFLRSFEQSALVLGAGIDQIPAIDEPQFDHADSVAAFLRPESLVVGVELGGDARAYPTNLLSLHEVVNDVVGGTPIVVTWCPLCTTALAFERRVDGRELTFGVSGYLYSRNLMLFDRQSGSLWSQLLGGAVTGAYRGTRLRGVPIVHQTWETWRESHPDTKVLSFERDEFATRFTNPGVEPTGPGADTTDEPFVGYATKVPYFYREKQGALVGATRIYGIVVRGQAKAYPLSELRRRRRIADQIAGVPVVVTYDDDAFSAVADAHGARVPGTFAYWFAWRALHPATAVYPSTANAG
jgi:hypothetical protein